MNEEEKNEIKELFSNLLDDKTHIEIINLLIEEKKTGEIVDILLKNFEGEQ